MTTQETRYVVFGHFGETGKIGLNAAELVAFGLTPDSPNVHALSTPVVVTPPRSTKPCVGSREAMHALVARSL